MADISTLWATIEVVPYTGPDVVVLEIAGVDRSADLAKQTLAITDELNEKANTASFKLYDLHALGVPNTDDAVTVTVNGVLTFAGNVTRVGYEQISNDTDIYTIEASDYTRVLDRRLVAATYLNMTDKEIIESIINEYAFDEQITTFNVAEAVTINQISFNYVSVTQAITQISKLTGYNWYIDYYKDIHYFPLLQNQAPFALTSAGVKHENLTITKDASRLRNRVFVRGGTELTTSPITETIVADGSQRQFFIAEKPHDLSMTVGGVAKTIGIKNIDDPEDFDYMLSFQEKYIECGTNTTTPVASTHLAFTYNYDVPVLISVEDGASIAENGVYEFSIIDKQISTTQQARDRATADLTDYASDIVDGQYNTFSEGLRSGQYQRVTFANKSIDEDYIITKVVARSIGAPIMKYTVYLTNAKTLGIIRFLIDLLNQNRAIGDFDPNEKVDQLFSQSETMDSILDSLVEDSHPTDYQWVADSGAPATSAKYNLASWR